MPTSKGPFEVFASLGKAGGCAAAQTEATARLVSQGLRAGIDPDLIVKQLKGIRCHIPHGLGEQEIALLCGRHWQGLGVLSPCLAIAASLHPLSPTDERTDIGPGRSDSGIASNRRRQFQIGRQEGTAVGDCAEAKAELQEHQEQFQGGLPGMRQFGPPFRRGVLHLPLLRLFGLQLTHLGVGWIRRGPKGSGNGRGRQRAHWQGIKVLEYGEFISAPYCCKLMADLGAEVIKVEIAPLGG